jgi:hypothetical protein
MENLDKKFIKILKAHDKYPCPHCGRKLDRGDLMWNNGSTGYGTPVSSIEIICQKCENNILHLSTWYPYIDDFEEAVSVLEAKWK